MRILITNDDGITAPGLRVLHNIATELTGGDGEIWTVAPAFEQSGVGHATSYTKPLLVHPQGPRSYAIEGTPADCVLAGIYQVMKDALPDLILSGVNRGNNSADNALYSGTLGAAMEGALQGIPAIALSQYYGPANRDLEDTFEAAHQHGADVIRRILAVHEPADEESYQLFYNVNFPPLPADAVKGLRVTAQGHRPGGHFYGETQTSPTGREYLWLTSGPQQKPSAPGTDAHANLDGYISVTPMRADLTDHAALKRMKDIE